MSARGRDAHRVVLRGEEGVQVGWEYPENFAVRNCDSLLTGLSNEAPIHMKNETAHTSFLK